MENMQTTRQNAPSVMWSTWHVDHRLKALQLICLSKALARHFQFSILRFSARAFSSMAHEAKISFDFSPRKLFKFPASFFLFAENPFFNSSKKNFSSKLSKNCFDIF